MTTQQYLKEEARDCLELGRFRLHYLLSATKAVRFAMRVRPIIPDRVRALTDPERPALEMWVWWSVFGFL